VDVADRFVEIGGALSSEIAPKYSWIPACALRRIAQRFAEGAKYTPEEERGKLLPRHNWQQGNEAYFVERLNHGIEHLMKWMEGDRSEDHLAAVGWMVCALMWAEEKGILNAGDRQQATAGSNHCPAGVR
jgi:hypothetical protein